LTGLRVFAAFAVYMSHVRVPISAPNWLHAIGQNGSAGVTFFFVLSGFVLTLNYHDRLRTRRQLWSYAVARFARIYPVYLVVITWPVVHLWAANALAKWQRRRSQEPSSSRHGRPWCRPPGSWTPPSRRSRQP
jgi:peptidoglycan/LPS O-acetylase OafA/YrhL